ncbi:NAD-P-binding protein [Crassisporium funariophilum]|nr:NAD-P-binding protein [Crassisporium funariophilum]
MDPVLLAKYIGFALSPLILLAIYIYWNDSRLTRIPSLALYFSAKRCTPDSVRALASKLEKEAPLDEKEVIPPKTGRRYIVVGGGGFLGGWIVTKLLERGEDFQRIRLLDLNPPTAHPIVKDALSKGIQFIKVDITDALALEAAFKAPWPGSNSSTTTISDKLVEEPEITVFHTAANIRFYERHLPFVDRSARVNVLGTKNVVAAARAAGATVLLYTSSGSVGVHSTRFFLWPWEKEPKKFVQVINDDEASLPKRHEDFFSNYAVTKIQADRYVRDSDRTPTGPSASSGKILRTGCIRPGNGVFGPRGDILCGAYLVRVVNPSWVATTVQSFSYVENCAIAHLCYEQRLVELLAGGTNPDIGGQAFCITDPGPTPTYGDVYTTLETLSEGECYFPLLSPTTMLLIAHVIETYYRAHHAMITAGWRWAQILPRIQGDIVNLQPSLFSLTSVHLIFDDSRARLSPEKGGLGYSGVWTTLEGLHKTFEEHKSGRGRSESRSDRAGVSFDFGFKFGKAKKGMGKVVLAADTVVTEGIVAAPVEVLTSQ